MATRSKAGLIGHLVGAAAFLGLGFGAYQLGSYNATVSESMLRDGLVYKEKKEGFAEGVKAGREEGLLEGKIAQYDLMKSPLVGPYFMRKERVHPRPDMPDELLYARMDLSFDTTFDQWQKGQAAPSSYIFITPGSAVGEDKDVLTGDIWRAMLRDGSVPVYLISSPQGMKKLEEDRALNRTVNRYVQLNGKNIIPVEVSLTDFQTIDPWEHVKGKQHPQGTFRGYHIENNK